ncbi:MAG: DNA polymerase II large subunit [Candidatus Woesearchaeota archaeon]
MNQTESAKTKEYFQKLKQESNELYELATKARKKGIDPEEFVEVKLAENLAERVIGLISSVAPQLAKGGAIERIIQLENKWAPLDWRVGMHIAYEISQQKFCEFKDKNEAMEVGIRTGFAYVTLGVVSAPLEGFTSLEIKKRLDGKEYFCINYAGPVRAAGGTAAAVSVLIADYVRKKNGYDVYDPTEKEIQRCAAEIEDYHEYVTNLQYFPSKKESEFLMKNLPVEISGDPSEKYEISSALLKDLPRIPTNVLRSGYCLIHSACIPLKGPKLWKQLRDWASEMDMDHWNFMEEFVKIQTSMKSKGAAKKDEAQLYPDYTYIKDLVGGRPVLGHPIRNGAFRLRYGRTRTSGFSAQAVNPATMYLLNKFLAIGTQLKVERPGKAAAFSSCSTIDGPIVLLHSGEVIKVNSIEKAKEVYVDVKEIIYAGDVLINYGDFYDRAHKLVPAGYCQEIWIQELEKTKIKPQTETINQLFKKPLTTTISFDEALKISKEANIPLHPDYTYYWSSITKEQLQEIINGLEVDGSELKISLNAKRPLELIGIPHTKNKVVGEHAKAIATILKLKEKPVLQEGTTLELVNKISPIVIKDKAGTFIGSRMGRPEKAKMRKLTGSPHVLFPVGEEGGRLKSFQSSLEAKKITEKFQVFDCECGNATPLRVCEKCKSKTKPRKHLVEIRGEKVEKSFEETSIKIAPLIEDIKKQLGTNIIPDLIKGVRGTWNPNHVSEHLAKGILRAKYDVFVNKDGTVRYDCSELPITHFKPREIGVTLKQLKELGYEKDIHGEDITSLDQTIEIKVQDIIIPCSDESGELPADEVLFNVSKFIDESLEKIYELPPYYNLKSKQDLIGQLAVGLAPHTSAGTVMRIIGFSKTQAFYAHPYIHAAMRRDCFSYDTYMPIKKGEEWQILKLGELVEELNPTKIVDNFNTKEIKVQNFNTIGFEEEFKEVKINNFTKHTPAEVLEIKTKLGRVIKTTSNHKFYVSKKLKEAKNLKLGDKLKSPIKINIPSKNIKEINLLEELKNHENIMIRNINNIIANMNKTQLDNILKKINLTKKQFYNYNIRDSYPINFITQFDKKTKIEISNKGLIAVKRDKINIPIKIKLDKDLLEIIGLYIAEGYARSNKTLSQIYIASNDKKIREYVEKTFKKHFKLKKSENKTDRVTYSSKIIYLLFTDILKLGSSAKEKRIPSKFLNLPLEKIACILRGYFEGDGSIEENRKKISCDTISQGLLHDLEFVLSRFGIITKRYSYTKEPGNKLKEFYSKKDKKIPKFTITKLVINSDFTHKFEKINFLSDRKRKRLAHHKKIKKRKTQVEYDKLFYYDEIISIKSVGKQETYCLNVDTKNHLVIGNNIVSRQCDGDEACMLLLLDAFLNFSNSYLPSSRGSTMDAPLVLTSRIQPAEVDDMVFNMDIAWKYPLELYEAAAQFKLPYDVKVPLVNNVLGTPDQYENMGFTHDTDDINEGVLCSAYKTLPSMSEKVDEQMNLAVKIRAVDQRDVARLIIDKHFIRDTKGNLRKFSLQQFRCVNCNEKYRRPPLMGKCVNCSGKVIFTISEGSVIKYMEYSLELARKYDIDFYSRQVIELTQKRIEGVFGKDPEKQLGLSDFT